MLVATGTADDLSLIACGHGRVTLTFPDELHVLVVDDVPGNGNGGTLLMSVSRPIAPQVSLTVSANGQFVPQTGTALLDGKLVLLGRGRALLSGTARQERGRPATTIGGFGLGFNGSLICHGTPTPWTAEVFPSPGDKYAGGPTAVSVTLRACFGFSPAAKYDCKLGSS